MNKTTFILEFHINVKHEPGTESVSVRKADSDLFFRALEEKGVKATRRDVSGAPDDVFVFESPEQADMIFKAWSAE